MVERDVVEFGAEEPSRSRLAGCWAGRPAGLDRRLVLGGLGLGALLVAASLFQTWQTTTSPVETGGPTIAVGIELLGAWGGGYLLGILGLAPLTGLAFLAAGPVRRYARLAALCWGGTLLGVVLATFVHLGRRSAVFPGDPTGEPKLDLAYGPGGYLALAGVAAVLAALHYSARTEEAVAEGGRGPAEVSDDDAPADSGYPRPDRADRAGWAGQPPAAPRPFAVGPVDLTVSPTAPFIRPEHGDRPQHRDR
ncbi:MAG TPA: hypothetical protein VFM55_18630 [Micromonosporaceae bacterium]|nr:hypothetical protein [Micromonosporaceae bacterium]